VRGFEPTNNPEAVGRRLEILLVEASLDDARAALEILRHPSIPCRVSLVRDGDEALEFLYRRGRFRRAPKPDAILLDMQLPGKGGREVLAEIKVIDRLCRIPVIVQTGSLSQEEALRREGLAVQGFLVKPLDPLRLLVAIRALRKDLLADVVVSGKA